MDVVAHSLWAGVAMELARRRWRISRRTAALTMAMAVMPDISHLAPIVGWTVFGDGSASTILGYPVAVAGQLPRVPENVDSWCRTLHCLAHSAIIAGAVTGLWWFWRRNVWVPLAGWWSHVVIDIFTHSIDYFPSPVLYPFTQSGFDGIDWIHRGRLRSTAAPLRRHGWHCSVRAIRARNDPGLGCFNVRRF